MSSSADGPPTPPKHPIRIVARRTGLKADLIRAWERRYDAVEPTRTDTGRRRYSDADVERLLLLRQAVSLGRSIGQIAHLPDDELERLIAEDRRATATTLAPPPAPPPTSAVDSDDIAALLLEHCLVAVQRLDARDLEAQLERGSVALSRIRLVEEVLVPLMHRIGELWHQGELRPAHEHLASAVARSFIGSMAGGYTRQGEGPVLVVATPTGQFHELGSLVVSACAATEGWDVCHLGSSLPAEEIAAAARQREARAVALSITHPPDDPHLPTELERLGRLLPPGCDLIVGGRSASAYAPALETASARSVHDLGSFRQELSRMRPGPAA
jgi:methanogenic corrinoid protein MtbC1